MSECVLHLQNNLQSRIFGKEGALSPGEASLPSIFSKQEIISCRLFLSQIRGCLRLSEGLLQLLSCPYRLKPGKNLYNYFNIKS